MTHEQLLRATTAIVHDIMEARGVTAPALDDATLLIGGGPALDSMEITILTIRLGEECGTDPFADSMLPFRTVGELLNYYQ